MYILNFLYFSKKAQKLNLTVVKWRPKNELL